MINFQNREAIMNAKVGRNDPCPCGSGKKYKQCCMMKEKAPLGKKKFTAKLLSSPKTIDLMGRTYGKAIEAAEKGELPTQKEADPS